MTRILGVALLLLAVTSSPAQAAVTLSLLPANDEIFCGLHPTAADRIENEGAARANTPKLKPCPMTLPRADEGSLAHACCIKKGLTDAVVTSSTITSGATNQTDHHFPNDTSNDFHQTVSRPLLTTISSGGV